MKNDFIFSAAKETGTTAQVINPSNNISAEQATAQCLPIILKVIRHLESKCGCKAGDLRNDFIQEGYLAVLDALSKYNSNNGAHFLTYAFKFIHGAIFRAFWAEIRRGEHFESAEGYDPEAEEFTSSVLDNLLADDCYNADYSYTSRAQREDCEWLLKRVKDDIDRRIVQLRYGLEDGFEHSLDAIGFILGTSGERVRQRHDRAMKQLRRVD